MLVDDLNTINRVHSII